MRYKGGNRCEFSDNHLPFPIYEPLVPSMGELFYKNATSENSVKHVQCIFENLDSDKHVCAVYEMTEGDMINLHNHMNSASIWKSVSQWDSGIMYTIDHPDGHIIMFDRNRGEKTSIYRESVQKSFNGVKNSSDINFSVTRTHRDPINMEKTPCNSSTYIWVRIESRKTFKYESERASWDFSLSVVWEGRTKEAAESSEKKYIAEVSMASVDKASRDPGYTTASFMEKLMDMLFQKSRDRRIVFV